MLKALLVDRNFIGRYTIVRALMQNARGTAEIGEAPSIKDALRLTRCDPPDLLFIDIDMVESDDLRTLFSSPPNNCEIIIVAPTTEHAIRALRAGVLDYLTKPIHYSEVRAAINRYYSRKMASGKLASTFSGKLPLRTAPGNHRIPVPFAESTFFFYVRDIIWLEAEKGHTRLHLSDDTEFVASKSLKHFDILLASFHFTRVHKSSLVNPYYIQEVTGIGPTAVLSNGKILTISRRKKTELLRLLEKLSS